MIKRAGNIVIMVLLLIATGGIPVTLHYCGSVEESFSIFSTPKHCCDNTCKKCHTVFKFSKVIDAFEVGSAITITPSLTEVVTFQASIFIDFFGNKFISSFPDLFKQRNILFAIAGHSPAFLSNFRC